MNVLKFIKILYGKLLYLIIIPVVFGGVVFYLTRNLPVKYSTEATIFTAVTSKTALVVAETRVDNIATQNEYNNILTILKSRDLYEETALRLFTQDLMLDKPQKYVLSEASFNNLKKNVPPEIKKLIVKGNFEKSYANLSGYIQQDDKNYIYRLLNYEDPHYSIKAISTLKSERVNSSDLIQLTYESDDAAISYNTVKIIAEVFIRNYSKLKSNQTNDVVKYYEAKAKEIAQKLQDAEDRLLKFNIENGIVNYYEQTHQLTTQQEKIEVRLQEVKMECEAADAVLNKLESEVSKRYNINLRNSEILKMRQQLSFYNNKIATIELNEESPDKKELINFKNKKTQIENNLKSKIDSIYIFDSKSQGIESQKMLVEWLDAVKNHESSTAMLKSMNKRLAEFMLQYKKYAPQGATIKRLEREIDVNEREYLNVLDQLGAAKLKQQSNSMVSNMKEMDEPKMPINPIPSKKKLYVIIASLFSLLFYIIGVFLVELLDHTIKTPSNLKKLAGYDVIAAFCMDGKQKKFINTEKITDIAAKYIFEKIRLDSQDKAKPYIIQIFSNWKNSGKLYSANIISEQLQKFGYKYKLINFSEALSIKNGLKEGDINDAEQTLSQYYKANNYSELIDSELSDIDFIISIVPPITNGFDNTVLLKTANINFVVHDANVSWTDADNFILEKYNQLINKNTYSILTNANPDNLEEMYGEIPKKRSALRIFVKKMIKRFI